MTENVTLEDSNSTKYFIAKCANIPSLKRCIVNEEWACKDRQIPPQPSDMLKEAYLSGSRVVIIFSVNNCHGWHGYAELSDIPGSVGQNTKSLNSENIDEENIENKTTKNIDDMCNRNGSIVTSNHDNTWHYFPVKWIKQYLTDFGEQCLPFRFTEKFKSEDNTPLNKARNWQTVTDIVGAELCQLIDKYYDELCEKQQAKIKQKEADEPLPFFKAPDDQSMIEENWGKIHHKIQDELGQIMLSCPFGSRRYNLHTDDSDMDMFIVYQADTSQILGFNPPKQTVKSNDANSCDYTIHEMFRYAELLLSGDPRCVETLFLNHDAIMQSSETFQQLRQHRQLFVTRECLDKYLRDALGSRGLKQFKKWMDDNPEQMAKVMPEKMCKLAYIILRLLQNACNIVDGEPLVVYRQDTSPERQLLMDIRHRKLSVQETWQEITRLQKHIEEKKDSVTKDTTKLKSFLESWLLTSRYRNIHSEMSQQNPGLTTNTSVLPK